MYSSGMPEASEVLAGSRQANYFYGRRVVPEDGQCPINSFGAESPCGMRRRRQAEVAGLKQELYGLTHTSEPGR